MIVPGRYADGVLKAPRKVLTSLFAVSTVFSLSGKGIVEPHRGLPLMFIRASSVQGKLEGLFIRHHTTLITSHSLRGVLAVETYWSASWQPRHVVEMCFEIGGL